MENGIEKSKKVTKIMVTKIIVTKFIVNQIYWPYGTR